MKHQLREIKMKGIRILAEPMGAESYFCAIGYSKKDVYAAEACSCGKPLKCKCKPYQPPFLPHPQMEESLFLHYRPMLLWTITNKKNPDIIISFGCKLEQEVFEEVERLNKNGGHWEYREEKKFNVTQYSEFKNLEQY